MHSALQTLRKSLSLSATQQQLPLLTLKPPPSSATTAAQGGLAAADLHTPARATAFIGYEAHLTLDRAIARRTR